MHDVLIVGGGCAGLSAALVLGRCRRKVLLCDDGRPRNSVTRGVHGFMTRDGVEPAELRRIGRSQLAPYDVEVRDVTVRDVRRLDDNFEITLADGRREVGHALLLATGMRDRLPDVEGFTELYGRSAFTCPYCDGWEVRDRPFAAYARGPGSAEYALGLTTWSRDVVLFTDGEDPPSPDESAELARHGVTVRCERVVRFEGRNGALRRVVLEGGEGVEREALFFHLGMDQRSDLASRLECEITRKTGVLKGPQEETCIPGLFVAGDMSIDTEFAIVAAAEGARAAQGINGLLRRRGVGRGPALP